MEKRFDPYCGNHSLLAITAAIEIDNFRLGTDSRLGSVEELGQVLEKLIEESATDPEMGFYTITDIQNAFQQPLAEYGYKLKEHTKVEDFRLDILTGLCAVTEELKRFASIPQQRQEKIYPLMNFCSSLSKELCALRHSARYFLAA